jgi:spore maturation protein CgeB
MKIVVFGLTISSSWGNGHATLWRGLCRALARQGHRVIFFERDARWYASTRDLFEVPGGELILYSDWEDTRDRAATHLAEADVAIVTSYCPDAIAATELVMEEKAGLAVFYDLDSPVTLAALNSGTGVNYIGPRGLADFDLVLSYTGGAALTLLRERLDARRVEPLYGHVDPDAHKEVAPAQHYRADLSYLGTYSADRQLAMEALFLAPARLRSDRRFVIGGAQYPCDFPWAENIYFVRHLPPTEHPAFFSSSRLTLNVTRRPMAEMGWCPSGRLFEAAACGAAILTDEWDGLDAFFAPNSEILIARDTDDTVAALDLDDAAVRRVGRAARERVFSQHTSEHRANELVGLLEATHSGRAAANAMET